MVRGLVAHLAVPNNVTAISAFRYHVVVAWVRTLQGRSQRHRLPWERMQGRPRILHPQGPCLAPMPEGALPRQTLKVGAWCISRARRDLCGGWSAMSVPTAIGLYLFTCSSPCGNKYSLCRKQIAEWMIRCTQSYLLEVWALGSAKKQPFGLSPLSKSVGDRSFGIL